MIAVIGLGYVGLTTALGLSEKGFTVYGFDNNKEKLQSLASNELPFYENELSEVLNKNLNKKFFIKSLEESASSAKIIFLCVETPADRTGRIDLQYLKTAFESLFSAIKPEDKKIIVIKSTVPPSTTVKKIIPIAEKLGFKNGKDVYITYNPEFLREGSAWKDFIEPDRIIIGVDDEYPKRFLNGIFQPFNAEIHFVSLNTGEFVKYLSNSFFAALLSYSNEMSVIADAAGGIDVKKAFELFHKDKRWFGNPASVQGYVYPSCGFGGSCLPKDLDILIEESSGLGCNPVILKAVKSVNKNIKDFWVNKITKAVNTDKTIAVLGLAFKPDTEDVRETPSYEIIRKLIEKGFKKITVYDPAANILFAKTYNLPVNYSESAEEAVSKSDVVILATAWQEFFEKKDLFKTKTVFDLRYKL
ncbi:MAG: UDP-glucose/GDP-mannose dehydrogenase family protein [Endomicrobiaceae bacterium]